MADELCLFRTEAEALASLQQTAERVISRSA
jgi:hypothetical protein